MWIISSTDKALKPNAIALGNFDGIHLGHQQVLRQIIETNPPLSGKNYVTVVSFNPHPREFFTGKPLKLLTPLPEKIKLLEQLGIDQLILLPFNQQLAALTPLEFVQDILLGQLEVKQVSVGEDFRFGCQRLGSALDLQAIAADFGVDVLITSKQICQENSQLKIGSSVIRQYLETGKVKLAKQMLGRAYSLTGKVIKGQQLGRTLGFPTANLEIPPEKFLPQQGVYYVQVTLENQDTSTLSGVMNIGSRPTINGTTTTIEVHLLDWMGDLYGQTITVSLEEFIRGEQKFTSLEALKTQISADCNLARQLLVNYC